MPALFSITKKTFFIGLGLLLLSSLTEAKPKSNFRNLQGNNDNTDSDTGCWIQSYGRGVGKPISTCPDGMENDASLCYPPCQDGYTGVGPVCWQNCPSGFSDTGIDCLKPSSYGRGAGYAAWHESECNNDNSQGCEKYGAMWYPKCKENFHNVGCCVCSPNCPSGMTDIGVSCQKQSYGRGAGKPLVCTSDQDEDAGLCYTKCKSGWSGDGPVCWGSCPAGMYQCGALCLESKDACVNDMLQIADEVLQGISEFAGDDDDEEGEDIDVEDSGVNIGQQLAQYGMCTNM